MTESGPKVCVECKGSRRFSAWWSCPECGDEVCSDDCAVAHAENCQKPPGYTCKICDKICDKDFADLRDYTMHTTTCVRPVSGEMPRSVIVGPHLACVTCTELFEEGELALLIGSTHYHPDCAPGASPKASGNQGVPPVPDQKRVPDEAKPMVAGYLELSELVFKHCPNNPERIHALRTLHESMQTAISSIVCADAWQTPKPE